MQKSFWWWQCSDRYIISFSTHLITPLPPSLISLMVSVYVKHHVYLTTKDKKVVGGLVVEGGGLRSMSVMLHEVTQKCTTLLCKQNKACCNCKDHDQVRQLIIHPWLVCTVQCQQVRSMQVSQINAGLHAAPCYMALHHAIQHLWPGNIFASTNSYPIYSQYVRLPP